jgi:aspartate/methionine/tyrosine aminotransferase
MSAENNKCKPQGSQKERVDFTQLALKHKALNLGQGFPDYPPPKFVTDALVEVANSPNYFLHQYTREFVSNFLV